MHDIDPLPPGPATHDDAETLRRLHRDLVLPRVFEERMLILLRQGRLSKWFSGIGQEAVAVGVASAVESDDWLLPMHRNLGVFTTRGVDLGQLCRQLFGRSGGFTQGRDRSFHFGTLEHRIVGMISHLGAMLPVACGLALAEQMAGRDRVAVAFTGDGATSEGDVHEALNLAAVWKLPVVFVIENNGYGLSTPVDEQYACARLADRAVGYGMPGLRIDGNDVLAVRATVRAAVHRARRGEGPSLIECMTFRMRGHEEASGTAYVPQTLFDEWGQKDPLGRFEARLQADGILDADGCAAVHAELAEAVRAVADDALQAPLPESTIRAEARAVFAGSAPAHDSDVIDDGIYTITNGSKIITDDTRNAIHAIPNDSDAIVDDIQSPAVQAAGGDEMRYVDAIRAALMDAMDADPQIVALGQDIAEYGGVFKITDGFVERFGAARVRNTPIIESAAIGCGLGLALNGQKPMIEMQFADFITCGFNQIVNNVAKTRYRWGAAVPLVIRAPHGGGVGAGPYHSQSVEGWFTQVAGLKVVAPATADDAYGLLVSALADPDPVLYLEHKALYRQLRGPVSRRPVPIGAARIARSGTDASIVTYGVGVRWALEAAERSSASIEVVDLRTLQPWDVKTATDSVRRTGKALVLHEAPLTGGFGGEIAATLGRTAFEWLDAPILRLGALDTPVPFARPLEALHSPVGRLDAALTQLLAY